MYLSPTTSSCRTNSGEENLRIKDNCFKITRQHVQIRLTVINPRIYTQIHTPTGEQGGGDGWNPSLEFLIRCSILK